MLTTLATLAALTLAQQGETDTTVAVPNGTRLDVNNFGGEIVVRTWSQSTVRVRASHSSRSRVEILMSQSVLYVKASGRRGPPSIVDFEITVPTWMSMTLEGNYTDISVTGAGGAVSAESVQGDISVSGGTGNVTIHATEGGVTLSGTRGRTEVNAIEGDVMVTDAVGAIAVETVDGDVHLLRIESSSVDVNTVDGDVVYDGTIRDDGRYRLSSHDGDIIVAVPPNSNVTVAVATFDGEFDSSFPVSVSEQRKHRFTFTIGRGSARLELESFDGDIRLRRPGQIDAPDRDRHKDKDHNYDF